MLLDFLQSRVLYIDYENQMYYGKSYAERDRNAICVDVETKYMLKDTIRQITIIIATAITIVVNLFSSFITGKSVAAISNRFPVPITPAGWAFSVWGIIYIGLIAYA